VLQKTGRLLLDSSLGLTVLELPASSKHVHVIFIDAFWAATEGAALAKLAQVIREVLAILVDLVDHPVVLAGLARLVALQLVLAGQVALAVLAPRPCVAVWAVASAMVASAMVASAMARVSLVMMGSAPDLRQHRTSSLFSVTEHSGSIG